MRAYILGPLDPLISNEVKTQKMTNQRRGAATNLRLKKRELVPLDFQVAHQLLPLVAYCLSLGLLLHEVLEALLCCGEVLLELDYSLDPDENI